MLWISIWASPSCLKKTEKFLTPEKNRTLPALKIMESQVLQMAIRHLVPKIQNLLRRMATPWTRILWRLLDPAPQSLREPKEDATRFVHWELRKLSPQALLTHKWPQLSSLSWDCLQKNATGFSKFHLKKIGDSWACYPPNQEALRHAPSPPKKNGRKPRKCYPSLSTSREITRSVSLSSHKGERYMLYLGKPGAKLPNVMDTTQN